MKGLVLWTVALLVMVKIAFELEWTRSLAIVGIVLLCALAVLETVMRLLRRRAPNGDDDGGPDKHYDGALLLEKPPKTPPEWRA